MHVGVLGRGVLALTGDACVQPARLVVEAVRAGDELAVAGRALSSQPQIDNLSAADRPIHHKAVPDCVCTYREPGLEVVLARRSEVEFACHDVNHLVRDTEGLVELLRDP